MARLDDLVDQVKDPSLRKDLEQALLDLKRRQRFGIVFEEHVPEVSTLQGLPVQVGSLVQRRDDADAKVWRISALTPQGKKATLAPVSGAGEETSVPTKDLLVVKRFGEPIYPALTPLGRIKRGGDKFFHAVINGENFHALQLLMFQFDGQVDCIYIDPPYNTGARDWKYNNHYVDKTDAWRHSKWLSMMEKRLKLAKRLLRPDGVLICTIDEHEVHHLGMLLERLFPDHLRYMLSIVINPKGTAKKNFARVDEYAFFIVPDIGRDVILPKPLVDGATGPGQSTFLMEDETADEGDPNDGEDGDEGEEETPDEDDIWEYRHARRRGSESSYRPQRPNQFYPIYVDDSGPEVRILRKIT